MDSTWLSENTWVSAKTQPAAPGARVVVGNQLGPYKLVAIIGSGGMGTVFIGEHELIGRRVAIKVMNPEVALQPEIAKRFLMEARLANSIASDSVVEVEDFARTADGLCYLVMELLNGADLASTVERDGIFPIARTVGIIRQVALALAAAHEAHIVHRDIKPENIYLVRRADRQDVVKILDFGLAKLGENPGTAGLTQAGTVVGTPEYMSPEQAFGLTIDYRTDIYSLGVVFYGMLAGQLPFPGRSLTEQMEARRKPLPPLPQKTMAGEPIPEPLARVVSDCLAQEPANRPASMRAVIQRIDAISKPVSLPTLPLPVQAAIAAGVVKPKSQTGRVLGAAILGFLVVLAGAAWWAMRSGEAAVPTTTEIPTAPAAPAQALAPVPTLAPTAPSAIPAAPAGPPTVAQRTASSTPAPVVIPSTHAPVRHPPRHHRPAPDPFTGFPDH